MHTCVTIPASVISCAPSVIVRSKLGWLSKICLILTAAVALETAICDAQTAHYSGAMTAVASAGLANPHGIAVDSSGNVYVADVSNNRVLKETPTGSGYTQSVVASSGLSQPAGVAVDANGNVYIADSHNNRILKESLSGSSYTESVVPTTGLNLPLGVAVDANGNLFIADTLNAQIVEEQYSNGNYTQRFIFGGPQVDGIVVDNSGDIYFAAYGYGDVYKLTPSGNAYAWSYVGFGLGLPHGVAVDSLGVVYIAESGSNRILKETPSGSSFVQSLIEAGVSSLPQAIAIDSRQNLYFNDPGAGKILKLSQAAGTFPASDLGVSSTTSMVFTFDTAGTIGLPQVLTQGATGLDYKDAGTGSCTTNGTNHSYNPGDGCTVDVVFTPIAPGARYGAAVLTDLSANAIATGYVQGTGVGPQVSFPPGTLNSLSLPNLVGPLGIAMDGAGNLYSTETSVGYDPANAVVKETWNGTGYTQSTIKTGFGYPTALAVDGAGNLYISDQDGFAVYKETPGPGGTWKQSVVDGTLGTVAGLAVDGAGNVYIGRGGIGVEKETLSGGIYTGSEIFYTFYGGSIAVDSVGNIYVIDGSTTGIRKEALSAGGYTETIIGSGRGFSRIKLDSLGNLYGLTYGSSNGQIFKETQSANGYVESQIPISQTDLADLAVDSAGNVYVSTYSQTRTGSIFKLDTADPPSLTFASTAFQATSADSPKTVSIENTGNSALTLLAPTSGSNPTISTSFVLDANAPSVCPSTNAGAGSPANLSAGSSCQLSVSFIPESVGTISGSVIITDNASQGTTSNPPTQTIALSGTATQATPFVSWSAPAPIPYGTALGATQLNATSIVAGSFAYSPAAGTLLAVGSHALAATFTPTDTVGYTTATASATITVTKAAPANVLTSSANLAFVSNPVTFTATLASTAGSPAGTVTFLDGSTQLGIGTLSAGIATYTTSSLAAGTHSITASYAGDTNFAPVTSSALTQTIEDFTFAPPSGGSTSATILKGGTATYTLAVTPPSGGTSASAITFAVTGVPTGATATFSPASVAAGSGPTNVTLTVSVPASAAVRAAVRAAFGAQGAMAGNARPSVAGRIPMALGVLVLPLLGLRRGRRALGSKALLLILALAGAGSLVAINGCGGGGTKTTTPQPQTYNLVVTATAGSLTHKTTLTLIVQ